jgi:hypothetical protein
VLVVRETTLKLESCDLVDSVLMTKFGESGKTGLSDFLFQNIRFW